MQEKQNNYQLKHGNQENITKSKNKWISNMAKELEVFEEGLKAEIQIHLLKTTLKKCQIEKPQAIMKYIDSGWKNSFPFTIN